METRKTYRTFRLAVAATFVVLVPAMHVYADDTVMTTTTTSTTKILGTVPAAEVQPTAPTTDSAMAPIPTATMPAPGTAVPEVAPLPPSSQPWAEVLPPQKSGDITYITGGIGDEERAALADAKKEFNLYVMNSNKDGTFVGDTQVVIRTTKGDTLLNVTAGPLLYVKLPTGSYTVETTKGGQSQKDKTTIGTKGASRLDFSW